MHYALRSEPLQDVNLSFIPIFSKDNVLVLLFSSEINVLTERKIFLSQKTCYLIIDLKIMYSCKNLKDFPICNLNLVFHYQMSVLKKSLMLNVVFLTYSNI